MIKIRGCIEILYSRQPLFLFKQAQEKHIPYLREKRRRVYLLKRRFNLTKPFIKLIKLDFDLQFMA